MRTNTGVQRIPFGESARASRTRQRPVSEPAPSATITLAEAALKIHNELGLADACSCAGWAGHAEPHPGLTTAGQQIKWKSQRRNSYPVPVQVALEVLSRWLSLEPFSSFEDRVQADAGEGH